ncbi:alcohol dehydrogenase catalytic domain-containing protein [Streptomyces sp. 4N509B]|uniref:alcohol dehydrogenase catalytic domain-containing protein n=1 Tax=Streptomyces sp. 4N509B TaxID=3457413 RepID=UPI003FD56804
MPDATTHDVATHDVAADDVATREGPSVMRAAVLPAPRKPLRIETRPVPRPGPGELLVRVRAAGVCHTDLHLIEGVPADPPLPLVLGHEIAGEVVGTGERVLVYYYDGCGGCRWCRTGLENLCRTQRAKWGFDADGGFAEYVAVPARCAVPLPASLGFAEAAVLGCSGTTAVHVVRAVADLRAGERVTVVGVGGVGLACVQVAVAAGSEVTVVDPRKDSREAALRLGAVAAVDPGEVDPTDAVLAATGGHGCDAVVDTVGNAASPGQAVAMLRPRGRVVLVGYTEAPASVDVAALVTREARVLGSVGATLAEAHEAVEMAAAGTLRAVIASEFPLAQVNEALAALRAGVTGRLVLLP